MTTSCFIRLRRLATVIAATCCSGSGIWAAVAAEPVTAPDVWREIAPPLLSGSAAIGSIRDVRTFALDADGLAARLDGAPAEFSAAPGVELGLPMPDGSIRRYRVFRSPIVSSELAARFPEIETFRAEGVDDPTATARLDRTPRGFHALIVTPDRAVVIEPAAPGDLEQCISYDLHDLSLPAGAVQCDVMETVAPGARRTVAGPPAGTHLRSYRTAIAITAERFDEYGESFAAAVADVVSLLTLVNTVYERDLAIRLTLVGVVAYPDTLNDPFPNLGANNCDRGAVTTAALNAAFGVDAYDFGHSLHIGGGGCAGPGPCGADKGGGSSGGCVGFPGCLPGLAEIVMHEGGHQLAASHTWSGFAPDTCPLDQRACETAVEPGGGSTLMSYAGVCGSNFPHRILFFNTVSIDQVSAYQAGDGNCGTLTTTGNAPPTVDAGLDYTIPHGTPFTLTASGGDPDGEPITYSWEQVDVHPTCALPPYDVYGPIFDSYPPVDQPRRVFRSPLVPVDRTLNFRCTVRDNRAGGGGVNSDGMVLTLSGDPFVVTAPAQGDELHGGCTTEVRWTVGGSVEPEVRILYGSSVVLVASTPNDGAEVVTLPCVTDSDASIRVEPLGNIYFGESKEFSLRTFGPVVNLNVQGGVVGPTCRLSLPFAGVITDDCGLDPDSIEVEATVTTGNASISRPGFVVSPTSATEVWVTGSVLVSDLTSCPAQVQVRLRGKDNCGRLGSHQVVVDVTDATSPTITATLNRGFLWPPNHTMSPIVATVTVTDNCAGASFVLASVTSDEPANGAGDGDAEPDIAGAEIGTADTEFELRSERAGSGDGRVYTIVYGAVDACRNSAQAVADVRVAHDQPSPAAQLAGFTVNGRAIDPTARMVAFLIPGGEGEGVGSGPPIASTPTRGGPPPPVDLDRGALLHSTVQVGDARRVMSVQRILNWDISGDGRGDDVILFSAAQMRAAVAAADPADGPLGLHYVTQAGMSFLLPDIFDPARRVDASEAAGLTGADLDLEPGHEAGTPVLGVAGAVGEPSESTPAPAVPPTTTRLIGVNPNPLGQGATVVFSLAHEEQVDLSVFDVHGARVRTLRGGFLGAGRYQVQWNRDDDGGRRLAGGLYFIRLSAGRLVQASKAVIMP